MIVRPEFYQPLEISREYERRRLGLRADLPTGLVMFGGFGSRPRWRGGSPARGSTRSSSLYAGTISR
jgi:hypothetical protein